MAPLEIRHRSVRPISAKHAQASRFLQQSQTEAFFRRAGITIEPVTLDHGELARQAFLQFGKGRHKAGLNFGDCFRSEEHTSELQSLMRISYAGFCLQNKKLKNTYIISSIKHPVQ